MRLLILSLLASCARAIGPCMPSSMTCTRTCCCTIETNATATCANSPFLCPLNSNIVTFLASGGTCGDISTYSGQPPGITGSLPVDNAVFQLSPYYERGQCVTYSSVDDDFYVDVCDTDPTPSYPIQLFTATNEGYIKLVNGRCLDANNGTGTIHTLTCDPNNNNHRWVYDNNTNALVSVAYSVCWYLEQGSTTAKCDPASWNQRIVWRYMGSLSTYTNTLSPTSYYDNTTNNNASSAPTPASFSSFDWFDMSNGTSLNNWQLILVCGLTGLFLIAIIPITICITRRCKLQQHTLTKFEENLNAARSARIKAEEARIKDEDDRKIAHLRAKENLNAGRIISETSRKDNEFRTMLASSAAKYTKTENVQERDEIAAAVCRAFLDFGVNPPASLTPQQNLSVVVSVVDDNDTSLSQLEEGTAASSQPGNSQPKMPSPTVDFKPEDVQEQWRNCWKELLQLESQKKAQEAAQREAALAQETARHEAALKQEATKREAAELALSQQVWTTRVREAVLIYKLYAPQVGPDFEEYAMSLMKAVDFPIYVNSIRLTFSAAPIPAKWTSDVEEGKYCGMMPAETKVVRENSVRSTNSAATQNHVVQVQPQVPTPQVQQPQVPSLQAQPIRQVQPTPTPQAQPQIPAPQQNRVNNFRDDARNAINAAKVGLDIAQMIMQCCVVM